MTKEGIAVLLVVTVPWLIIALSCILNPDDSPPSSDDS